MLNKKEFVERLAKRMDRTQKETAEIVEAVFEEIMTSTATDGGVKVVGFGSFEATERAERVCKNPQTGEEINVPAKVVPKFKAGSEFKKIVAGE